MRIRSLERIRRAWITPFEKVAGSGRTPSAYKITIYQLLIRSTHLSRCREMTTLILFETRVDNPLMKQPSFQTVMVSPLYLLLHSTQAVKALL